MQNTLIGCAGDCAYQQWRGKWPILWVDQKFRVKIPLILENRKIANDDNDDGFECFEIQSPYSAV